ncbi:MAG: xanthine dehydrogenase family protein subunit M, partial [Candidatus Nanopelagicales bacterium]
DAKVLAGGQSLMPVLRLRMAAPTVVIDCSRVTEMQGITDAGDAVVIGAGTTHHEVMNNPLINEHTPLLAMATATVADPAIRHRGTLGGALAHADPAGDLPAVALALDAVMTVTGPHGSRDIPAAEFFTDYFTTSMAEDEILVSIRVPKLGPGWGYHYEKFQRTAQGWAIVGVAAAVQRSNGTINQARVGLTNMGPGPVRASSVEQALTNAAATAESVAAAAQSATDGTRATSDLHAAADYREHLARVMTERAVAKAAGI